MTTPIQHPPRVPRPAPRTDQRGRAKSMHEGIAVWCDCCSCEMEPYWAEAMGVERASDYEDAPPPER